MTPRVTAAMCAYGRTLAEPRLSPDGSRIAFLANVSGRGQLVVLDADGGPELVVTSDPAPRPAAAYGGGAFDWVADGSGLVYAAVDGGLWRVPSTGGAPVNVVTKHPAGPAAAPAVSPDGDRVAFVVDQHHLAVCLLDGDSWPVKVSAEADFCFDPSWSPDGTQLVWHEWDVPDMPWDGGRIVQRSLDDGGKIDVVAGGAGISVQQPRWSPDGRHLAYLSDERGWLNLWVDDKPLLDETCEHGDPTWGLGQRSFAWSPDGEQLAFTRNERGFGSLHVVTVATGDTREIAKAAHGGLSWRGDRLAAVRSGARAPTQVVVYDGAADRRTVARGPLGGFEALDLPEPEVVEWTGDDGGTVHGRLYRPARSANGHDAAAAPPVDPRRADRPDHRRLDEPHPVLPRSRLGAAVSRPPRVDRARPRLRPGDARSLG